MCMVCLQLMLWIVRTSCCCADNIISKYLQIKLQHVANMMPITKEKVYLPKLWCGAMSSWAASIWKHCDLRNVTSSSTSAADWHTMTVLYRPWYPSRISVFALDSLSYKHCFLQPASIYIYIYIYIYTHTHIHIHVCVCVCVPFNWKLRLKDMTTNQMFHKF